MKFGKNIFFNILLIFKIHTNNNYKTMYCFHSKLNLCRKHKENKYEHDINKLKKELEISEKKII